MKSLRLWELPRDQHELSHLACANGAISVTNNEGDRILAVIVDPAVFDLLQDVAKIAEDPQRYEAFYNPPFREKEAKTFEQVFG